MAEYFDEHGCEPLGPGEAPNHLLHLARLLLDTGVGAEFDMEFSRMHTLSNDEPAPPASKKAVDELSTRIITLHDDKEAACPVCLKQNEKGDELKKLPCKHEFHTSCILPWLQKTNSCPVCRLELPTDNEQYEEFKKQKARVARREAELDILHDSMFG